MKSRTGPTSRYAMLLALFGTLATPAAVAQRNARPMVIERQGSFAAGGSAIGEVGRSSTSCDHGFVEFQIPAKPRTMGLFLWHSSSTAAWQNRWDGGEGFQNIFLRRGFPIYLWDGPRVGRANAPCGGEPRAAPQPGRDQASFTGWRFGASYPNWFPGVQFPTGDKEAWNQAVRARYEEFDTVDNAWLQAHAAAAALERTGRVVLVTNSAAGLRALLTALESDKVAGIIAYENVGYVLPDDEPRVAPGPFGPIYVSREQFRKLARIPMQFVWGDNLSQPRGPQVMVPMNRRFVELINAEGGNAEILELANAGLKGNTHVPFADMNNVAVADLLEQFLRKNGLDGKPKGRARR